MSPNHLLVLVIATLVVLGLGMTVGRRIVDWIFPTVSRILDAIDDRHIGANERRIRASYRRIQSSTPEDLRHEVERAFQAATSRAAARSDEANELIGELPDVAKRFFQDRDRLTASESDVLLDITLLRAVTFAGKTYLVVGRTSEDGSNALYAVLEGDPAGGVFALEIDDEGEVVSVEPEARSLEHFIASHVAVRDLQPSIR